MKIKFIGFRGFDDNSGFIDLQDITILLGKNSSGKSTVIKLLLMLKNFFNEVNSMDELFRTNINIANNTLGAKANLIRKGFDEARFVFECSFQFYRDYHECHLVFKPSENELYLNHIEIYDTSKKKVFWTKEKVGHCNLFRAIERYNRYAPVHNANEMFCYSNEIQEKYDPKADPTIFKEDLEDPTNRFYVESYCNGHIGYSHPLSVFSFEEFDDLIDYSPFVPIWTAEKSYWYCLFSKYDGDLIDMYKAKLYQSIKNDPALEEDLRQYEISMQNEQVDFSLKDAIHNWTKFYFTNYKYLHKDFKNKGFGLVFYLDEMDTFFPKAEEYLILNHFIDLLGEVDLFIPRFLEINEKIFESEILRSIKKFSNLTELNNVFQSNRTVYNLYDRENIYSIFINHRESLDVISQIKLHEFVDQYLKIFQIGQSMKVEKLSNQGTLKIRKSEGLILNAPENGTGISKLLQIILFLAISRFPNRESEEKVLILQEPESNLHPRFQSLLSDLFIDFALHTNHKLIIETHSEYLLKKLQILSARQEISNNRIGINYFDMKSENRIKIQSIMIASNGNLSSVIPEGFSDVTNNITNELFKLNHQLN